LRHRDGRRPARPRRIGGIGDVPGIGSADCRADDLHAQKVMLTGHGPVERALRLWLPVGFFLIVALFPFYWMAVTSLKPNALLFIPLADLINRLDLGNTLSAVILTYPTMLVPFCAWLLLGYFKTVPKELEEAARIDGASRLQTMRRIFLPLCTPGFISAGIFAFTLSQNEFLYALIFLTQSSVRTVPVGVIAELIRGDVFYWRQLMAGALLGSI